MSINCLPTLPSRRLLGNLTQYFLGYSDNRSPLLEATLGWVLGYDHLVTKIICYVALITN